MASNSPNADNTVQKNDIEMKIKNSLQDFAMKEYSSIMRLACEKTLHIDDCFVNLNITGDNKKEREKEFYPLNYYKAVPDISESKQVELKNILDPGGILITGPAGIGKTVLCQKLFYEFYTNGMCANKFQFLIWLPLRSLKNYQNYSLSLNMYSLLVDEVFSYETNDNRLKFANYIDGKMTVEPKKFIFLLDGLDEIIDMFNQNHKFYNFVKRLFKIDNIIVTSRPHGAHVSHKKYVLEVEIAGFNQENIIDYVLKVPNENDANKINNFIYKTPNVRQLVNIPIMLDMVCYCWEEVQKIVEQNSQITLSVLFETFVSCLFEKDFVTHNVDKKEVTGFLSRLAFVGLLNNRSIIFHESREIIPVIMYILKTNEKASREVKELWDKCKKCSLITKKTLGKSKTENYYCFIHATFQDYFAAKYIVNFLEEYPIYSMFKNTVTNCKPYAELERYNKKPILIKCNANYFLYGLNRVGEDYLIHLEAQKAKFLNSFPFEAEPSIVTWNLCSDHDLYNFIVDAKDYSRLHAGFITNDLVKYCTAQISVQQFIAENKYNPNYQNVWPFVFGLIGKKHNAILEIIFDLLNQEPFDLIQVYHQSLLLRCLCECEFNINEDLKNKLLDNLLVWFFYCFQSPDKLSTFTYLPATAFTRMVGMLKKTDSLLVKTMILEVLLDHHCQFPNNLKDSLKDILLGNILSGYKDKLQKDQDELICYASVLLKHKVDLNVEEFRKLEERYCNIKHMLSGKTVINFNMLLLKGKSIDDLICALQLDCSKEEKRSIVVTLRRCKLTEQHHISELVKMLKSESRDAQENAALILMEQDDLHKYENVILDLINIFNASNIDLFLHSVAQIIKHQEQISDEQLKVLMNGGNSMVLTALPKNTILPEWFFEKICSDFNQEQYYYVPENFIFINVPESTITFFIEKLRSKDTRTGIAAEMYYHLAGKNVDMEIIELLLNDESEEVYKIGLRLAIQHGICLSEKIIEIIVNNLKKFKLKKSSEILYYSETILLSQPTLSDNVNIKLIEMYGDNASENFLENSCCNIKMITRFNQSKSSSEESNSNTQKIFHNTVIVPDLSSTFDDLLIGGNKDYKKYSELVLFSGQRKENAYALFYNLNRLSYFGSNNTLETMLLDDDKEFIKAVSETQKKMKYPQTLEENISFWKKTLSSEAALFSEVVQNGISFEKELKFYEKDKNKILDQVLEILKEQNYDQFKSMITDKKNMSCRDQNNNTLTNWAVLANNIKFVKLLSEKGLLNLSDQGKYSLLPIHIALLLPTTEMLQYFIKCGWHNINPYVQISFEINYYHTVKFSSFHPFHFAVLVGNNGAIDAFLNDSKFCKKLWKVENYGNVLHIAVLSGKASTFAYLLDKLSEEKKLEYLNDTTLDGKYNVINYAALLNKEFCLHCILNYYQTNLNMKKGNWSEEPSIALCNAIICGSFEAVQTLVAFNVKTNVGITSQSSFTGKTPQNVAEEVGQRSAIITNFLNIQYIQEAQEHDIPNLCALLVDGLAFQGGGVKGIAYVGAIEALEICLRERSKDFSSYAKRETLSYRNLKRVVGTSAGAICSLFLSLGCSHTELNEYMNEMNVYTFLDNVNKDVIQSQGFGEKLSALAKNFAEHQNINLTLGNLVTHPYKLVKLLKRSGLCSGEKLLNWLGQKVKAKIEKELENNNNKSAMEEVLSKYKENYHLLTFGDLGKLANSAVLKNRFKHLHVIASRLTDDNDLYKIESINSEDPQWDDVLLIDAIRASTSYPFIFEPYKLRRIEVNENGWRWKTEDEMKLAQKSNRIYEYIDGGLIKNYPIEEFDKNHYLISPGDPDAHKQNRYTLGFSFKSVSKKEPVSVTAEVKVDESSSESLIQKGLNACKTLYDSIGNIVNKLNLKHQAKKLGQELLKTEMVELLKQIGVYYLEAERLIADYGKTRAGRTIDIKIDETIEPFSDLTDEQKEELKQSARDAVFKYFKIDPKTIEAKLTPLTTSGSCSSSLESSV